MTTQPTTPITPDHSLLTVCSWCRRVRMLSGKWLDEETPEVKELLATNPDDTHTHGLCPLCSSKIVALLTA